MAFNLGAFAGGIAEGFERGQSLGERRQQMEDRKLAIQQHQRALDDAKLDDAAEAALANYYGQGPQGGVSGLPGGAPGQPPQPQMAAPPMGGPQQIAPPMPPQPPMQSAPLPPPGPQGGMPGPQIGAPPGGMPQPPMPGQPSMPSQPQGQPQGQVAPPPPNPYAAPVGSPSANTDASPSPSGSVPSAPGGAPSRSPVDLSLLDQSRLIARTAQGIKAKNPGIDDRTLLHALAKAGELEGKFGTEGKAIVQAQIQMDRINSENDRKIQDITARANLQAQKAENDAARDQVKNQALVDLANVKAEHAKQIADIRAETARMVQDAIGKRQATGIDDKKAARQDALQRATMIRDRISQDAAAGRGDKAQLAARAEMSKNIIAQMNAAQRIMNGIELASPGVTPETNKQYDAAIKAYDQAASKLDALEKATGAAKPSAGAPQAAAPKPKVGETITGKDGKKYKIVGGDPNDPDVEEVK